MKSPYEYAVLRAAPRVQRGEFVNVGVLLYCREHDFLRARWVVDQGKLRALDPDVDVDAVCASLELIRATCAGDPEAGPAAATTIGERFRWLAAPRSTVVHAGPTHGGVTDDPEAELDRLLELFVR
jgi:Protein of unknown function (DUF3037)